MRKSYKGKACYKLVLLGEATVGKTSLMRSYVEGHFQESYKTTIGADFLVKQIELDKKELALQIWDTAGAEKFSSIGNAFYRGADCCALVFDLTSRQSFDRLPAWKQAFIDSGAMGTNKQFPFVVLGNKCDDAAARAVSEEVAKDWCTSQGISEYYEVSAKAGTLVDHAFRQCAILAAKNEWNDDLQAIYSRARYIESIKLQETKPRPKQESKACC